MIKRYETKQAGIDFKLDIKDNLILIGGQSGSGKTLLFEAFQSDMVLNENSNITCINYTTDKEIIAKVLKNSSGKLFIIDNADIMLDTETRRYVAFDTKNQYILIGRDTSDLILCNYNKARVIIDKDTKKIYLKYFG